jgi:hypothetical protein
MYVRKRRVAQKVVKDPTKLPRAIYFLDSGARINEKFRASIGDCE